MSEEKRVMEVRGETVEDALEKGLTELNLSRDQVSVEIVDEGRRGFLGVGGRETVLRLTQIDSDPDESLEAELESEPNNLVEEEKNSEEAVEAPAMPSPSVKHDDLDELDLLPDPNLLEEEETAAAMMQSLLTKMGYEVEISSNLSETDDLGKQVVEMEVSGDDDLGNLIGKRGDTLASLQYILRLMVSQQLRRRVDFVIDVDGHRRKRKEGLTRLAERMAGKVLQRNRPVTLEPMTSYERRLVHMALRAHEDVFTRSIGDGRDRRVRILPKK